MSENPDPSDQPVSPDDFALSSAQVRQAVFIGVLQAGSLIAVTTFLAANLLPTIPHAFRYSAAARVYDRAEQCQAGRQLQDDWARVGLMLSSGMQSEIDAACSTAYRSSSYP